MYGRGIFEILIIHDVHHTLFYITYITNTDVTCILIMLDTEKITISKPKMKVTWSASLS